MDDSRAETSQIELGQVVLDLTKVIATETVTGTVTEPETVTEPVLPAAPRV